MSETIRCPDCGHENPPGSANCGACNFPLAGAPGSPAVDPPRSPGAVGAPGPAGGEPAHIPRPTRPIRPRRPHSGSKEATTLWLTFGSIMAIVVLFIGIKANVERASQPVPGSSAEEQERADELRGVLEKDSTNVDARIALADILYNTANWPEAIVHYRSVVRQDSSRVAALVDLGVCYFNLGNTVEAERHFLLGLAREPNHPVALFNLGIVNEQRERYDDAFEYFHRALQSAPPGEMTQPIAQAIERVMKKQGKEPPPLPAGR